MQQMFKEKRTLGSGILKDRLNQKLKFDLRPTEQIQSRIIKHRSR